MIPSNPTRVAQPKVPKDPSPSNITFSKRKKGGKEEDRREMILDRKGSSEILLSILYFISLGTKSIFSFKMFLGTGQRKKFCTGWIIALAQVVLCRSGKEPGPMRTENINENGIGS